MKNNPALIIASILVVAILGFYLAKSPRFNSSKSMPNTETVSTGAPSLSFAPSSLQLASGKTANVTLTLDPNSHTSVAATLAIKFDPTKVSITQVKTGTMFPVVLSPVKISNGLAEISVGTAPSSSGETQTGTVISFDLKSLSNSSSVISLGESSAVASLDLQGNILKSMGTLKIN